MKEKEAIEFLESKGYNVMNTKPYCYWSVLDVELMLEQMQSDGKFKGIKYTDEFGYDVMELVDKRFDAEYGVSLYNIESAIEEIIERQKKQT